MGVLEGCDRFLKYIFFFFTFVLWLLGLAAIGVGIWAAVDKSFKERFADLKIPDLSADDIRNAAILICIIGVMIMVVGFFGCCGAKNENQCLLSFFFISLFIIFVCMIAGAVLAYGYQDVLQKVVKKGLAEMKKKYDEPTIKANLDAIQQKYECCEFKNGTIPQSCYQPNTAVPPTAAANATAAPLPQGPLYTKDCATAIMAEMKLFMDTYKMRIAGVGVAAAIIVVMGMIVSLALCCKIRRASYQNV